MQKDPSKGYLVFTKKEKRGTLCILAVIVLIFISAKYIYPLVLNDEPESVADLKIAADSLKEKEAGTESKFAYQNNFKEKSGYRTFDTKRDAVVEGSLFYFDPNTLDKEGWQRLGVKEKTIATIQNYLSKGGKFREPADLQKIWGLRDDQKERLIPYARIAKEATASATGSRFQTYEKKSYERQAIAPVDINAGDSAAFVSLPGIGPGFSKRIINFRNKLGGFYNVEQVGETFGLPDSVFQKIKPLLKISGEDIRKININTATNDELKAHPYIRWQLANVILEYRKQHGDFKSVDDLRKVMILDAESIRKMSPYLKY